MMRLIDLINQIPHAKIDSRFKDYVINILSCDSREEQVNGLFVALPGLSVNGADFIKDAITKGARAVAIHGSSRQIGDYLIPQEVALVDVDDPKVFLRQAARIFYGNPSADVCTVGITGTNGKTTITYLLESIIHANCMQCGIIGTVNYRVGKRIYPSKNTTPGFLDLQRFLFHLKQEKVDACVMEVSSHALHQGRLDGINFTAAVFTNLTQDHLDYHRTMEDYFQAKALLFTSLGDNAGAIINSDDVYGKRLVQSSKGRVLTYAIDAKAAVRAENIRYDVSGTQFDIIFPDGSLFVSTRLVGRHNVYNILAAAACAFFLKVPLTVIKSGIDLLSYIPGRLELVDCGQDFAVFIDYAHTEDGLVNVLGALRTIGCSKITVVFGCGGDRDKTKRPKMGRAVSQFADFAFVTSDNPRSEDPQAIINDILSGFTTTNYIVCPDRREAITQALSSAKKGHIILLAGKGHEDYQILKDKTIQFNERKIVESFFNVHH